MRQATKEGHPKGNPRNRYWVLASRFMGASVVSFIASQAIFLTSYSLGAVPALATALGWLAGATPNFMLNRRNWGVRGRASLRREIVLFGMISVTTAVLAALISSAAEQLAITQFPDTRTMQVVVVWGAYLCTYVVMAVAKFFLFDRLVFTSPPQQEQAQ